MSIHQAEHFFPQGIALGDHFCNRVLEKERLKKSVLSARPTLIMSPRRYGKTSLVMCVLSELALPFAGVDFYAELNDVDIQNATLNAIGDILYAIESTPKKALHFVADFFSELSVSFRLVDAQIRVEFANTKKSPAKVILESLEKLDAILTSRKKKAVLFFDEFQRLSEIAKDATIEGAMRHVAQKTQHISFIFSGSNRHLLGAMFDERNKPLYKLCDRMLLDRIHAEDYLPFLQNKAKKRWDTRLEIEAVSEILELTARHPYYINVLCFRLWLSDVAPSKADVKHAWEKLAVEEKPQIMHEIGLLSSNQAKILIALARYGDRFQPMSKEFINIAHFSLSSVSQAIKALVKMDFVSELEGKYTIIDPLVKYIFSEMGLAKK